MFKQAQATWNLDNVEGLTDEQYVQCLDAVHELLSYNVPQRKAWKLQPNEGPEDAAERDTPKALYSGEPMRYKNYSYRLLCYYVEKQQPGATPLSCSERVFEDALQQTNEGCHSFFRGLPPAAHYQGPQCFAERANAAKLVFDPCQMPPGGRRRSTYSDGSFLILQCCQEGCGKWRRVDPATYDLYWNAWMQEQRDKRRETVLAQEPHLSAALHAWLRETVAEHFKPRPRARTRRSPFRITLATFHVFLALSPAYEAAYTELPRGFLEVFLDDARAFLMTEFAKAYDLKEEDHLDVEAFEAEAEPLPSDESATPKFACTDLVD